MTEDLDPELPTATAPRPRSLLLIGLSLHILPLLIWGKVLWLALLLIFIFRFNPAGLVVLALFANWCAFTIYAWRRNTLPLSSLHLALSVIALSWVPLILSTFHLARK